MSKRIYEIAKELNLDNKEVISRLNAAGVDVSHHSATVDDPVLERRRRIAGLVRVGQRAGYGLFGLAIALFVVGLFAGFGGVVGAGIVAAIVVGSIVLAPAIVFGYAVRAAEREDREQGRPTLD